MRLSMVMKVKTKKAFALSITMWIVASLMFAAVIVLRFAKDELKISKELNNKLEVQMMTQNILEVLKFYIFTADSTSISLKDTLLNGAIYNIPKEIVLDGREYNLSKGISISLRDTSGLINVFSGPSNFIASTLTKDNILRNRLIDTLDDWRDKDDIPKINGAEQYGYDIKNKGGLLKVRNSNSIQDIDELSLIKGFEKIDFKLIQDNLYYGESGMVNLALINNPSYLGVLLNLSYQESLNLLHLREDSLTEFIKRVSSYSTFNDMYMGFSPKKQFLVTIKAQKGRAKSILNVTIDFSFFDRPYMTISYKII